MKNIAYISIIILFFGSCSSSTNSNYNEAVLNPVFDKHVEPIIYKNCTPCHRENGGAPFTLTSYKDVKKKAKTIAKVTKLRYMPPWPADVEYSHFIGEKRLTDNQIEILQNWVKNGTPSGDFPNKLLSKVKPFISNFGKPDLVLDFDSISLSAGDQDRFFLTKVSAEISEKKWVKAIEIVPGQRKIMHHFNGHLINYNYGSKSDFNTKPVAVEITKGVIENLTGLDLMTDNNILPQRVHSVVNYLPGVQGIMYPEGIGTFQLNRQFSIVGNDVHYGPTAKNITDKTKLNLFFTDVPPKRGIGELMLGTNGVSEIIPPLQIQPNTLSTHRTEFKVPEDISVLTVNPHMHLLGKSLIAYAIKPNGDTIKIINIPKWDFRWQYFYTFKKMLKIPKGSLIRVEATFDNTKNNPFNPFDPPQLVGERMEYGGSSMRATDEMLQFIITYLGYKPGDENISLEIEEQ